MSQIVFDAIAYAAQCHQGQYRKATQIPYIVHPVSMVRFLARLGAPPELQAAAALHDVIEDTEATYEDVAQRFGDRVAALVNGVTEQDRSLGWRERKERAIAHARACTDVEVLALKCVDKLDNLSDIREDQELHGEELWTRFKSDRLAQIWYYQTLTKLFSEKLDATKYADLAQAMEAVFEAVFGSRA